MSDGIVYEPVHSYKKQSRRIARCQRNMSRKKKFGKNWQKDAAQLRKEHRKAANIRKDHLHKTSTTVSKNHAITCIEDLRVKNMSKSAAGTIEQPGTNVRQKAGLNRSILDQGWSEFGRYLEYKQEWNGGMVIIVPAKNTSRQCSLCLYTSAENRKTQARFKCCSCGFATNADLNAARNILAAVHAVLARGELAIVSSVKQYPFLSAFV